MSPTETLAKLFCLSAKAEERGREALEEKLDVAVRMAEEGLLDIPLKVALMGCIVNGPGEAREADIGIAGGVGEALLFSHGQTLCKVSEQEIIPALIAKIKEMAAK